MATQAVAIARKTNQLDLTEQNLQKATFKLALPAIGEMLMQTLLGFADMAMVGSLGAAAIAAVGLSDMPMMTSMAVFAAMSVGTTALVARMIGANEPKEASNVAKQSLIISIVLAVVFTFLGLIFAKPIIYLMGAQADVFPLAVTFFKITTLGIPMMIITMIMAGVLRGSGDTKTPMYINGLAVILNIFINFFLIFPNRVFELSLPLIGHLTLHVPGANLGVAGSAISTTLARCFAGLTILILLLSNRVLVRIDLKEKLRVDWVTIKRILNIGYPAAIEQFLMRFGQLVYGVIVSSLGTVLYAAHRITLTAESISFNVGFGFALAATTLVGQYLGAQRQETAEKSGYIAVGMGIAFMTVVGIFFFIWPDIFIKIFTHDPAILPSARQCLRIVAVSQPFLAAVMGFSGALRGAGDTRRVLIITLVGIWGIRITLAYFLAITLHMGLIGAWLAMTVDLIIRGLLFLKRFSSGKWKTIKV